MKPRQSLIFSALLALLASCSGDAPKPTPPAGVPMGEVVGEVSEVQVALEEQEEEEINTTLIPSGFHAPTLIETPEFKLVPLGPELVDIDYEAYMSSIEHLQETFTRSTSWPHEGITDEDAMLDMETEQARFENRESFAYAVLTPDGSRERGCVYVLPSSVEGYDARVIMWVTKAEFDAGFNEELYEWTTSWIASDWPFEKVVYPGRGTDWDTWDGMVAEQKAKDAALTSANTKTAEGFIDAFYSFDPEKLRPFLTNADETAERIFYYQGWAEGGNYIVLERGACEAESPTQFDCPITVQDDPVVALKTGFNVTDTFHIKFEGNEIASVKTSSNDQPIYYEARKWVEDNMPDVMAGPCHEGGNTPGDCARAMTEGYKKFFAATREGTASE
ncbi:MAG: hypothetical protein JJ956_00430 [Pseudomonadales bacterium]|nr:hypothetical protein [Pseudomonadales bacterium]